MKFIDLLLEMSNKALCDIFLDTTGAGDYDLVLRGEKIHRPLTGYVTHMSPDEYLKRCADMQGTDLDAQVSYIRKHGVYELTNKVKQGTKLDMPWLDYESKNQEGRHRAMVAKGLGCEDMSVAIFLSPGQSDPYKSGELEGGDSDVSHYNDIKSDKNGKYVEYHCFGNDSKELWDFCSLFGKPNGESLISDVIRSAWRGRQYELNPDRVVDFDNFRALEVRQDGALRDFLKNGLFNNVSKESLYDDWEIDTPDDLNNVDFDTLWWITIEEAKGQKQNPFFQYFANMIRSVVYQTVYQLNLHCYEKSELVDGFEVVIDRDSAVVKLYFDHIDSGMDSAKEAISYMFKDTEEGITKYGLTGADDITEVSVKMINQYIEQFPFN
jgi:hypothetical protein